MIPARTAYRLEAAALMLKSCAGLSEAWQTCQESGAAGAHGSQAVCAVLVKTIQAGSIQPGHVVHDGVPVDGSRCGMHPCSVQLQLRARFVWPGAVAYPSLDLLPAGQA